MGAALNTKRDCHCKRTRHQHGTYQAYQRDRCRCPDCRHAWTRAATRYKAGMTRSALDGQRRHVPQPIAARVIGGLYAAGYTAQQIADETGLKIATISDITGTGQRLNISTDTFDPLAAMAARHHIHPADTPATSNHLVDNTGAIRRVQGLIAMGWPTRVIADEAGLKQLVVRSLARATRPSCTRSTRDAILAATRALTRATPPDDASSRRARDYAARMGFIPLAAWEDDAAMDDPDALPLASRHWRGRQQALPAAVAARMHAATVERARRKAQEVAA